LRAAGKPLYVEQAPTLDEMTRAALAILERSASGFLLVVEEEGIDNFGNQNNAAGMLESLRRADAAIATALNYREKDPQALVITAADSDGGGMQVVCYGASSGKQFPSDQPLPARMDNAAPFDGVDGAKTTPFLSAPDRAGERFPFGIAWATHLDVGGAIAAKAAGLHGDRLPMRTDNTDIYRMLALALFGKELFDETPVP